MAELGYTIVHCLTYVITLQFWNNYNPYYIAMFVAEEIPNLFNFAICGAAILDNWLAANNSSIAADTAVVQRALYYWKPVVNFLGYTTLCI